MPGFAAPWLLLLVAVVPPLTIWWLRRRRPALRYSDTRLFTKLPAFRGGGRFIEQAGATARALTLCLLIVALAGPRWPDEKTRLPVQGIALEMVIDVSGSMIEHDFDWPGSGPVSRLDAAKRAFRLFVDGGTGPNGEHFVGRPDDLIGLVTFDERPRSRCPLTLDHDALMKILEAEQPRQDATNIGDALAWGLDRLFQAPPPQKALVLLTDGYHNVLDPKALTPRGAATLAASLDVPIYTIDAGRQSDRAGESTEERTRAVAALQEVARRTGGQYFEAGNTAALLRACHALDQLQRAEIQTFRYRRYHEYFAWFGLAALAVWVGIVVLEATLWQRIP